jgi:hypothetical protein
MEPETLHQVFKMFVSTDEMRTKLLQPFMQSGSYISTDGHSLIMIPVHKAELNYKEQADPDVLKVMPKQNCDFTININQLEKNIIERSENNIDEYDQPERECVQCNGEGFQECDLGHEHECGRCGGEGYYQPGKKTGKQKPAYNSAGTIGEGAFWWRELERFIKACRLLKIEDVRLLNVTKDKPALIQAGDFTFIVCPAMEVDCPVFYELK